MISRRRVIDRQAESWLEQKKFKHEGGGDRPHYPGEISESGRNKDNHN